LLDAIVFWNIIIANSRTTQCYASIRIFSAIAVRNIISDDCIAYFAVRDSISKNIVANLDTIWDTITSDVVAGWSSGTLKYAIVGRDNIADSSATSRGRGSRCLGTNYTSGRQYTTYARLAYFTQWFALAAIERAVLIAIWDTIAWDTVADTTGGVCSVWDRSGRTGIASSQSWIGDSVAGALLTLGVVYIGYGAGWTSNTASRRTIYDCVSSASSTTTIW